MSLQELYQELILDHGTNPRNHCALEKFTHSAQGYNPLCGDKIVLYLDMQDTIARISFLGQGCAISQASASIMTGLLAGKTTADAIKLANNFINFIVSNSSDTITEPRLLALAGVKAFPARVKCATLPWHALLDALNN